MTISEWLKVSAGNGYPRGTSRKMSPWRRYSVRSDVDRMRREMWAQFAPDQELPEHRTVPTKRHTLTDEDYSAG